MCQGSRWAPFITSWKHPNHYVPPKRPNFVPKSTETVAPSSDGAEKQVPENEFERKVRELSAMFPEVPTFVIAMKLEENEEKMDQCIEPLLNYQPGAQAKGRQGDGLRMKFR